MAKKNENRSLVSLKCSECKEANYTTSKNKTFAWDVAGEQIFHNVLKNNGGIITYPVKDKDGDIDFCGKKFIMHTQQIGGELNVDFE